ncbi:MerR family transcriptional regulator [Pararobbsia silviterrae]|uniref:MerR family transcriptional regulator n=1 Tax=Pararobbsia silviterrae TaxID=1792498 RepID=A0A494XQ59_9BURK|nr:MerR family transcriptional regulator [Pararobbsia silviterrae]RKP49663.1 MerR family transcriptional regulator [Pararobbsia silviterrae]
MKIGELSRRSGISVRMLRYYEQEGLLQPNRQASGYRDYDETDEQVVRRIRMLGEAGLKLDTIRQLLPCVLNDRPDFEPCAEVLATLKRELGGMDERIKCLRSSRKILADYLGRLA